VEQHDSTFFCYVKEKVKILQTTDKHVVLLIDEITSNSFFITKVVTLLELLATAKKR